MHTILPLAVFALLGSAASVQPPAVSPQAAEFFESRVRPVLAEHCFTCHGPKRQQAGLRFDSRAALVKGSDSGPMLAAGDPEKSLLVQAICYPGEIKMPPKGKLPPEAVEALTAWVKMGVPWPESAATIVTTTGPPSVAEARCRPVDLTRTPFSTRRPVYGRVDRQNLPGRFRTFDFASPDATSPQRHTTTVPQQALFLMNSPFVIEQARRLIAWPDVASLTQPEERIERLYRVLYSRAPEREEVVRGRRFLEAAAVQKPAVRLTAWEQYAQVLLLSNEFAFMD
jgi:mono/diheme cytochrome c family protein